MASQCAKVVLGPQDAEDGKMKATMIGIDLAKNAFQAPRCINDGSTEIQQKADATALQIVYAPPALVVLEAWGSAHYWAREVIKSGYEVELVAPHYVMAPLSTPFCPPFSSVPY